MRDGKSAPPSSSCSARATLGGADSAGGACRSALHPRAAPPTLLPGDAQSSALLANRTKTTMWVRKRAGTRKPAGDCRRPDQQPEGGASLPARWPRRCSTPAPTSSTRWPAERGLASKGANEEPGKRRHQRAGRRSDKDLNGARRRHHPRARPARRAHCEIRGAGAPADARLEYARIRTSSTRRAATPIAMSPQPAAEAMEELRLEALSYEPACSPTAGSPKLFE